MYTKQQFSLHSIELMRAFVESRSFGVLSTHFGTRIFSSPVPFDLCEDDDGKLFVTGHIARANEMLAAFVSGNVATMTVMGPDTFVPAEWFGVRHRIPTWLYCSVEISGRLEPSNYETMVKDVNVMIARLQQQAVPGSTWTLGEISPQLSGEYLKHIAGYRIYDLEINSCYRLNQGKDHSPVLIEHLRARNTEATNTLADLVADPPTIRLGQSTKE